jgi:outer membrane protein TolC
MPAADLTMIQRYLVLCGLMLALPGAVAAETLDDAWAAALASHRQISAAAAERDAADFEVERARAARLPQLGLATRYTRMDEAPSFSFGGGLTTPPLFSGDDFVQAGAEISLPIFTSGGVRAGVAAAEAGAGAAAGRLATVAQDIRLGVAEHYVAVLRAESAVDVAESIVASLVTHTDDTKNRYDYGAVPQNDYLAASVTLANARQRLLAAENGLDYARAAYNRFLGRPLSAAVALDPELDIDGLVPAGQGLEALIDLARTRRPELQALEQRALSLRRQSDGARAGSRPQLALTGGYMFLENEFLDDEAFWMAGVALRWNLFDGGRSRKHAAALDSRAQSVNHSRADLESMVALQVRGAFNDRAEAESRLDVALSAVDQASENLRVVRNRYAAGASTNVEVLDAAALREQSLSNRDDARFEVTLAKLRLARAVGAL